MFKTGKKTDIAKNVCEKFKDFVVYSYQLDNAYLQNYRLRNQVGNWKCLCTENVGPGHVRANHKDNFSKVWIGSGSRPRLLIFLLGWGLDFARGLFGQTRHGPKKPQV